MYQIDSVSAVFRGTEVSRLTSRKCPSFVRTNSFGLRAFFALAVAAFYLTAAQRSLANVPGGGSGGANVTLTDNGTSVTLANGIVTAKITKASPVVTSLQYKGNEMVDPKGIYWSMDGGTSYQNPNNCKYTVVTNTTSMVDISCKHTYASGDAHVVDIDIHYVLRQGSTGLYAYAILSHPASYPDFSVGEWRMVWSIPADPSNTDNFLMENVYVDSIRHWQAPSKFDLANATTTGIKEIQLLNTGVRIGQYECKYEYAPEYYKVGTYGWASNIHNLGEWVVLGNYEYFNDGPPKQDLGPGANGGGMLLHFGRNHFNGSSTTVPAGQSWSKIYGPFFLYLNSAAGGDACWADAKAQVDAEHSAWPYTWLTTTNLYPQASARGTVTGQMIISDPVKPTQTAAGAWVGVTDAPSGTNWQMWSGGYEYWVQADASGNFTIPNIRPGTYTLSSYVTGEVGEYTKTNVSVSAGGTTSLGSVTWNVSHPGLSIAWEIGVPDRTSAEFAEGTTGYYIPYEYQTLHSKFPNPVTYTVGSSNPAKDFPYVQSALWLSDTSTVAWPWDIKFNLASVPASGNATLTLAIAGANSAHLQVYVNGSSSPVRDFFPAVSGGNGLLREVNHAKYCVEYVTIPVSSLQPGTNTIRLLQASTSSAGNHVMYDYVNLELPVAQTSAPTFSPDGGTYTSVQSIAMSSATANASIRYSTDGSTPTSTTGTIYSGPVTLNASKTLKAIAYLSGQPDSVVSSAAYIINIFSPTTYQAESGTFSPGGVVETTNAGWNGTGYVNTNNVMGAYWELTVTVPSTGSYQLDFRFANGTAVDRPADLSINGTVVQSALSFPSTGTWTTWNDVVVSKTLTAGSNKIRLTATTANGDANIDQLTIK